VIGPAAQRGDQGWRPPFRCHGCQEPYPSLGFPYRCPRCGDIFDLGYEALLPALADAQGGPGMARYRRGLPLPPGAPLISLGEGETPLVPVDLEGRRLFLKNEQLNPTGSFKDRGSAVLVSALAAQGIKEAVEDSSGNAGASFAAYAARAGIQARIYVPDYASGPKRRQIEAYGARVIAVPGPRSAAAEAVMEAAEKGAIYASHAHLPHGLAGFATLAFELHRQLGGVPGSVIAPVGQGSLILGLALGFRALQEAGLAPSIPRLYGVQARACAPLWALHQYGAAGLQWVQEGETRAEGIRILRPLRGDQVLEAVEASGGEMVAVEEEDIAIGRDSLARMGFYVEPTSAVVWPALKALQDRLEDPVVVVLTGSGFKSP